MILARPGSGESWYAMIRADGIIALNPKVANARELLADDLPNLASALDAQEEAEGVLDAVSKLFKKKGALVGEEADVFEKVDKILKKRSKK
jgi:hypothetical protein